MRLRVISWIAFMISASLTAPFFSSLLGGVEVSGRDSLADQERLPVEEQEAFFGRDAEIRTRGLTHPKGARYQAAPRPVKAISV